MFKLFIAFTCKWGDGSVLILTDNFSADQKEMKIILVIVIMTMIITIIYGHLNNGYYF